MEELAELCSRENGKHVDESKGEILRGIEVVELAASMTTLMKGETLDQVSQGVDVALYREPLGVVTAATPFNFPMMIPLWFAPLAIATGNTFILKPSQRTPLSALKLAELFSEAGFPDGVFNIVHGARETVEALIDHPEIKAISSVGGSSAARNIYKRAAERGKRVQALGGAKNHIVVMPDADLEAAAQGVFSSAFSNGGQRWGRGRRDRRRAAREAGKRSEGGPDRVGPESRDGLLYWRDPGNYCRSQGAYRRLDL